jgi:hypothetical protein
MPELRDSVVVLGASMGGLLAARVLADFYGTVTVVERDVLPHDPVNRRGVRKADILTLYSAEVQRFSPFWLPPAIPSEVDRWRTGAARPVSRLAGVDEQR